MQRSQKLDSEVSMEVDTPVQKESGSRPEDMADELQEGLTSSSTQGFDPPSNSSANPTNHPHL